MATRLYLEKEQFKGQLEIQFGNSFDFDVLATEIEQDVLLALLGFKLRLEYLRDVSSGAKFQYLRDGIATGWTDGTTTYQLKGIKEMVKYFFFYEFMTNHHSEVARTDKIEEVYSYAVSGQKARMNKNIIQNYNKGIDYYNELIDYINYQNSVNGETYYDEFEPTYKEKINIFGL